jgi:2-deoxy-D-gluconate 3-dehydrogenase
VSDPAFSLTGCRALVTGAATGLGQAICVALADAGVAGIAALHHRSDITATSALVEQRGCAVWTARADLAQLDEAGARELVAAASAALGPVDVLVNNAGINPRAPAFEYSLADFDAAMAVNARAAFLLSRAVAHVCSLARRPASIVNVASLLSSRGGYRNTGYTASKHALAGLTRLCANEWGHLGIRVNAVAPGFIRTSMTEAFLDAPASKPFQERTSLGRWGQAEDIGRAVVFLASPAAAYVHGTVLTVDGGFSNS